MKNPNKKKGPSQKRVFGKAQHDPQEYTRIMGLYSASRFDEAQAAIEGYTHRFPLDADGWNLAAMICRCRLQMEQALEFMKEALRIDPRNAAFWNNIGAVYKDQGNSSEAIDAFEKTLAIDPNHADALYNLGFVYHHCGQYSLARKYYEKSLSIKSDNSNAIENLIALDKDQGKVRQAVEGYQKQIQLNPDQLHCWSNMLLCMNYIDDIDPKEILRWHLDYGRYFENRYPRIPLVPRSLTRHRKLRIGFVSGDFRTHSIAFFLMPFLVHYDRSRFECYAYHAGNSIDETTRKMQALMDHWRSVHAIPPEMAADQIQKDHIDVLVDLSGHTGFTRLDIFLRKPAPIQVTWLGYPNTTGLSRMDYRITDGYTDPEPAADGFYSERLIRLPHSFLCYQAPSDIPEPGPSPAQQHGIVTFGSFNNHVKISPFTVKLWSRILHRIDSARLVLKSSFPSDAIIKKRLIQAFESEGISAERIRLIDRLSLSEHFRAYHQIDIALDTAPYNGTTTTCEALYMGVPVLALEGRTHASRVSAGILAQIGLTDWIASTPDDYVDLAIQKASDIDGLATLRSQLRGRMQRSLLMDAQRFTAAMQDAFRWMWSAYCDRERVGKLPRVILIAAMEASDIECLRQGVETLLLSHKPGTQIEKLVVRDSKDWDLQVAPLLEACPPSLSVVVHCRRFVPQVKTRLAQNGVCAFYVHRDLDGYAAQAVQPCNADPLAACSGSGTMDIESHVNWMGSIPQVTVFRRIDWETDARRMLEVMAVRLGVFITRDAIETLAQRLVDTVWNSKGSQDMRFDRTGKPFPPDTGLPREGTLSDKDFRFTGITSSRSAFDAEGLGFIEGYVHPDAEDIPCGDGWWISLPKNEFSPETMQIRSVKDFPEPEQLLLMHATKPGCCGMDIGSGYALYTMTSAHAAGPQGTFWAFEPDRTRWAFSLRSIALSAMHQIRLVRTSLDGGDPQDAGLSYNDPQPPGVISVDEAMRRYDMPDIDWIRIGESVHPLGVLSGGSDCFTLNSPLVQISLSDDRHLVRDVIERMRDWGYVVYRLIPGLGCLAPFGSEAGTERLPKHLFWCKPDRAAKLASWGVLVRHPIDTEATGSSHPSLWLDRIRNFPYALRLIHLWEDYLTHHLRDPAWRVHQEAMSCYALSQMHELPLEDRWQALGRAHRLMIDLLAKQASFARLLTMARIAVDMGYTEQAFYALQYLLETLEQDHDATLNEPFYLPNHRLDFVDPGDDMGAMMLTSILETIEQVRNRMGKWTETENAERIETMRTLCFYDQRLDPRRACFLRNEA